MFGGHFDFKGSVANLCMTYAFMKTHKKLALSVKPGNNYVKEHDMSCHQRGLFKTPKL